MPNVHESLETRLRSIEQQCDDHEEMTLQSIVSVLGHSSNYLIILLVRYPRRHEWRLFYV